MALEIERKFLVCGEFKNEATSSIRITQGYLNSAPERAVRIRIQDDKAFLTIKGLSSASGISRYEWEKEIPAEDARELLKLCEMGIIDKTRYIIPVEGHCFEVDEFHGLNEGLVLAEVELSSENEQFVKPAWLGTEVSTDKHYYNSFLSQNPYKNWR